MNTTLSFHGAAGTVTGSCSLLTSGTTNILIDCGVEQGTGGEPDRGFAFDPASLSAVVLTHGHLDHSGRIPRLFAEGFKGPVIAHYATGELADIVWQDSLKLSRHDTTPLFYAQDYQNAKKAIEYLDYDQEFSVDGARIRLYDAGHILGSSHVEIELSGKRVLFSGDIGVKNTPIIRDPHTKWPLPYDAAVIESTYGNRLHKSREDTILEFWEIVKRVIDQEGVLLIPAFAIGRTQEILYHFNAMVESGEIPRIPVMIDSPMAQKVTKLYRSYTVCYDDETCAQIESGDFPLEFPGLHAVTSHGESMAIPDMRPPFVVVAGSGMCTGGRILNHLKAFLGKMNTTVMLVGYQAEGTLGRSLVEGARSVTIDAEIFDVHARIVTLGGFSAHADRDGLLEWAGKIDTKQWLVNHGEDAAARGLAAALNKTAPRSARAVRRNDVRAF